MANLQFHVLYREFLFRMVDREVLSAHAMGDANKLMGRFAAVLVWASIPFAAMALGVGNANLPWPAALISAWGSEHALIATAMLITGLFAVLSWDYAFPSRQDILVLAPLPVSAGTIVRAKAASLASALGIAVCTFNAAPGLAFPFALTPPGSNLLDMVFSLQLYRGLVAYWVTIAAAAIFVLCLVLFVQGMTAILPRALSLRLSPVLQIITFCICVGMYFLQPSLSFPQALSEPHNRKLLARLPSYWFLGLFQQLDGVSSGRPDTTLAWLAVRACAGSAIAVAGASAAFLFSSLHTLRKSAEQPDVAPGSGGSVRLPNFGNAVETAIVQFSIRTLCRSRQHRVILSFYSGIGFAIVILFVKTPFVRQLSATAGGGPHQLSLPLLASSFVMMCFWILGIRVAFAMPVQLRANWTFRITPVSGGARSLAASRRAMYVIAVAPSWAVSAASFLWIWPWRPAAGHIAVLGILGVAIAELCLYGFRKIPFTCSWLPGKSNVHMTVILCLMFGLNLTFWAARFERRALDDAATYAWMLALLAAAAVFAWWRTQARANSEENSLDFEEAPDPVILSLGLHRDGVLPTN